MNPTEIYDALAEIASQPFDAHEFPFAFAAATDGAKAAIDKLRNGSSNKSDLPRGVLFTKRFHYAPAAPGQSAVVLDALRASKKTKSAKPAILIATDGQTIAAEHPASGDPLHCRFDEIGDNFGFFLPAAGKERYRAVEENPVDVKATGKLARLYDALIKANPDWGSEARRHEMNQLMMRLIFCMFAEDVGIFSEDQFSGLVFTHAGEKGQEARETIVAAFTAMNLPKNRRATLPAWTHELEYVNGGLFAGTIDAPRFDVIAFRYLREACSLNWREINPDIFGSMIQSVADSKQRSELGMHYTSVPNIMKVIGPLFLDDLDGEIHKAWDRAKALQQVLERMSQIRVFDPACGSGNFLVVAYRELRTRETQILQRLEELNGPSSMRMFSAIAISNFYGIEIDDFAAETAKLALFVAEYQANSSFAKVFGRRPAALPLNDAAKIRQGNSLVEDWAEFCPLPQENERVFIAGNPPFAGAKNQTTKQKQDRNDVFECRKLKGYKTLDFVSAWFVLATDYVNLTKNAKFALVSTSSVTQGRQVPALWPYVLKKNKIFFAHRPFKWRNNASSNAAVDCVVVGVSPADQGDEARLFDDGTVSNCKVINGYLVDAPILYISQRGSPLFGIPQMIYGSMPNDGGALIVEEDEANLLIEEHPRSLDFLRPLIGTTELIDSSKRYCLWIEDKDLSSASEIEPIRNRIDLCRKHRLESKNPETVERASTPHKFWHIGGVSQKNSIVVASASSERREVLPCDYLGPETIASNLCFVIHDGPEWTLSIIMSRLHLSWISGVCGKLEARYRYSSSLGWHTFPVPNLSDGQLDKLSASARRILKCRYSHYPATIAQLYDPEKMPDDLREAHRDNDELLETMYIGRPFRNDTERLETLFKLYAAKTKSMDKPTSQKKGV